MLSKVLAKLERHVSVTGQLVLISIHSIAEDNSRISGIIKSLSNFHRTLKVEDNVKFESSAGSLGLTVEGVEVDLLLLGF